MWLLQVYQRDALPGGQVQVPGHPPGPAAGSLDQHCYQLRLPRRARHSQPRPLPPPPSRLRQSKVQRIGVQHFPYIFILYSFSILSLIVLLSFRPISQLRVFYV